MIERMQDRALECQSVGTPEVGEGLKTVKLSPWGNVESVKGTYILDDEAAAAIVASFETQGNPLPIDVEHETVDRNSPLGQRRGAVGWIEKVYSDVGKGLMGLVRWTDRGRELIRSGAFPYLSPVLYVRVDDRKAVELHSAGLTVKPAIPRMERLAAAATSETTETTAMTDETMKAMGEIVGKIAGLLELDATGELDALLEAIHDKIKKMVTDGVAKAETIAASASQQPDRVIANAARIVLGLTDNAGETETLIALGKVCVAAMTEKDRVLKLNVLVDPWIRRGVLRPDDKYNRDDYPQMLALAASSPDTFQRVMRERTANLPAQGLTTPPPQGDNKKHRTTIIRNAVAEFRDNPAHGRITTAQKFANLALMDAGEAVLHSDELALVQA